MLSCIFVSLPNPPQALVRCAEDVIHTLEEMLPFDGLAGDQRILDLERLKEKLYSAVHFILQTLKAVTKYHHSYKKAGVTSINGSPVLEETPLLYPADCCSVLLTGQQVVQSGPPRELPPGSAVGYSRR